VTDGQTDRRTDGRTDRITTPKTALASLRRAVKIDLVTMYKITFPTSFAVDCLNPVQLYDNVTCVLY